MPGEDGPTVTDTPSVSALPMSTSSGLPGLTAECTQAVNAQVAISTLFAAAVNGTPLTADQVAKTFTPLADDVPRDLADDISTLHQTATAMVGKKAGEVADALNGSKASAAMTALNDYIKGCTPATS